MGDNDETMDFRGPDNNAGTIDGRYQLGPVLGRGAMSTVYRAQDLLLGRDVAIKIFLPGSGDESFRARQETEMRLLAAFDHPGLVAAFDAGVDTRNYEERAYLVMELAEGRDLRAVLTDGPLTVPETTRIGVRLAGALSQVHSHGVIHRDIKPANILVSEDSGPAQSVKLADFGVALVMDDHRLTATGFTVGTAQYLSPEQAKGLHLTPASDIYSLGLVLLECLTGKAEYPGTPVETASARLHRAPEIPEHLPSGLRGLLKSMTDMDPEQRPKAREVEAVLVGRPRKLAPTETAILPPVPSRPPHAAARHAGIGAFWKRHPRVLGGVLATAVAVPVAMALLSQGLFSAGTSPEPSQPIDPAASVAAPQPNTPAAPKETTTAGAVPAADVQGPEETVQVAIPVQPVPAPAADAGTEQADDPDDTGNTHTKADKPEKPEKSEKAKGKNGD